MPATNVARHMLNPIRTVTGNGRPASVGSNMTMPMDLNSTIIQVSR
jgi:hypothetical protein